MSEEQVPPPPPESPPPPPEAPPPPPSAPPVAQGGPPTPPAGGATDNRSVMIGLSYLWILALIPLLTEKEDREVQWHAKHGLVLLGAEVVLWIVLWIIHIMFVAVVAPLGCVTAILMLVVAIGILGFHVLCIVKGVNGERVTVPQVSELADRF